MAFEELLSQLHRDFSHIGIGQAPHFCWAPATGQVLYPAGSTDRTGMWSMLHEFGHAALDHRNYQSDVELVMLEVAAWAKAKELAGRYRLKIDEDHIQDCIDTYRDWLHRRSICPSCSCQSLQHDNEPVYECFNCHTTWRVSQSRFCRPYRRRKPLAGPAATFSAVKFN